MNDHYYLIHLDVHHYFILLNHSIKRPHVIIIITLTRVTIVIQMFNDHRFISDQHHFQSNNLSLIWFVNVYFYICMITTISFTDQHNINSLTNGWLGI